MPVRIVLVEDNPADVFLIEEALRAHGFQFDLRWIADGEQAVGALPSIAEGECPDLFLLDLNLPRVDGKEVLTRIRQTPAFASAKVAILTSSDSPADRRETELLGADCYIQKPPTLDEFMQIGGIIQELLGREAA